MTKEIKCCLFLLVTCVVPSLLYAQDDETDNAQTAFSEGTSSFENGNYPEAAQKFREAYAVKPSWKLLFNIGQAEASAKRHGLAFEAFEGYLSEGGDDVFLERRELVQSELDRLQRLVGAVRIKAPDDSTVFIDDIQRGVTPLPGSVKIAVSKIHSVVITLNNEVILSEEVKVSRGETIEIFASAPEEGLIKGTGAKEATSDDLKKPPVFLISGSILAGLGVASLTTGAILGGKVLSINSDLDSKCPDGQCEAGLEKDFDKAHKLSPISTATIIAGSTLATAGVVMMIVHIKEKNKSEKISMLPALGSGFAGAVFIGSF